MLVLLNAVCSSAVCASAVLYSSETALILTMTWNDSYSTLDPLRMFQKAMGHHGCTTGNQLGIILQVLHPTDIKKAMAGSFSWTANAQEFSTSLVHYNVYGSCVCWNWYLHQIP